MSNRPKAVDFLHDDEPDNGKEDKILSEEEPIFVSEAEAEVEAGIEGENETESECEEGNVESLPSGAMSKGHALSMVMVTDFVVLRFR